MTSRFNRYVVTSVFGLALLAGCVARNVDVRTGGDSTSARDDGQVNTEPTSESTRNKSSPNKLPNITTAQARERYSPDRARPNHGRRIQEQASEESPARWTLSLKQPVSGFASEEEIFSEIDQLHRDNIPSCSLEVDAVGVLGKLRWTCGRIYAEERNSVQTPRASLHRAGHRRLLKDEGEPPCRFRELLAYL
jgi:hypothetical protein